MIKETTSWKKATLPEWCITTYSCSSNKLRDIDEYGAFRFIPRKLCRFKNNQWTVSYLPHFDFATDLEKIAAKWDDNMSYRETWDKIGEKIEWNEEIMAAYETERKAESDPAKRKEIDKKYIAKYAA